MQGRTEGVSWSGHHQYLGVAKKFGRLKKVLDTAAVI
jgi:hypothetical protein